MTTTVIVFDSVSGDDSPQCIEEFADLQTAREAAAMFIEDACADDQPCWEEVAEGHMTHHEDICPFYAASRRFLAGSIRAEVDGFRVTVYPGLDIPAAEGRWVIERLDAESNHP